VVGELIKEFIDLRLDLRLVERLGDRAAGSDLDIFVGSPDRFRHDTRTDGRYQIHHLIDDPYVAVIPIGHRLADRSHVELAELAAERWVDNDFSHGICRQVLIDACAEAGFTPDFRIETHDYPTAVSFVATGIGVTVLPTLGVESQPFGAAVVPVVNPTPVRHIFVAVKASVERHPAAIRALELLRKRVSQSAREGDGLHDPRS
jgi:DNA-binding transcriptional LysR family regulator